MTRGIYTAATGMQAEESAQQVIAQNLANASTTGYKQEIPVFKSFQETLVAAATDGGVDTGAIGTLGHGADMSQTYTDLTEGPMQQTGNSLDIALRGDAYLNIKLPNGTAYSRDGALTLNEKGTLVQIGTGLPVLNQQGQPINLPQGASANIGTDGTLSVDGKSVDKIALYKVTQADQPQKMGDNLISTAQPAQQIKSTDATSSYVESGYLEASNVNIVKEMVTMIACLRSYEANSKALQSQDSMQDKAANQIGLVQ